MKKLTFILLVFVSNLCLSQTKPNYNIGILLDYHTKEVEPLLQLLKEQIITVVGEDATINFPKESTLVNTYDLEKAKANYARLVAQENINIILAFGIVNNEIISKQESYTKPTILFGAVNKDFHKIDLNKKKSGIANFTYLINSQSYLEDLQKLKELTNFKKVGIIIDAPFVNILPLQETFDRELKEINSEYKLIPFQQFSDIFSQLEGIDAVYLAGGFFLTEAEIKKLAKTFKEKKLPSFTVNSVYEVQNGIMATNQSENNFDQFLRRLALTVENYINGTALSEMPVYIDYNPRLTINYNTAMATGVPIKYSLLNSTDFVGEMKVENAKKNYNLLSVMEQVLDRNLGLLSSKKNIEISAQNVKSAQSNYLPNVNTSATATYVDPELAKITNGQNPEFSTAGNITLQQTIFSPAASAGITIQKNLKEAQVATYNTEEFNTILNASKAYFNTLILKTNTQIRLRNLDLTKKNLQIAKENFEAGESGKSDVLRFRSELAQNTQAMVEAINQLEQSFIGMNQILNNPIELPIDVEDAALDEGIFKNYNYDQLTMLLDSPTTREPFISFLVKEAKENAPELKALQYNLNATERSIQLSGSNRFLPTVALQGQYNHIFNRSGEGSTAPPPFALVDSNYSVGLNLSLPIFNRNKNNIDKQTAEVQKEQIEFNQRNSELNITANVRSSVLSLVNQISNISLSKVSEQTAKESLELTQSLYQEGAVNFVQLIDVQNNYLKAQLARANAVYNFLINAIQLERNIGYFFLLHTKEQNDAFIQRFQNHLLTNN